VGSGANIVSSAALVSSAQQQSSGGNLPRWHPWIHSPTKVKTVEPEIVEAVIEVVEKVVEARPVEGVDKSAEIARAEKELRAFIRSQEKRWKKEYAQLIMLEYERREQEYEDAQIAMLLFDL